MNAVTCGVLFAAIALQHAWSLQVIPERTNIVTINDKYLVNVKSFVKRYGRRSKYYINLEGTNKHLWGNNVTIHLIFYEYLHNEYKRSFVEMHFKLCELLNKEPYIGQALTAVGAVCPLPAGIHKFHNITIPADNFPNVWPFERCKVDWKGVQMPSEDVIYHFELFLLMKQ